MFTKAVARLEDARAYTDPRLIEVLQEILGHCSQALEHRGDVGPTVTFTNIVQGAVKWSQAVAVPREVGGEWRVAVKAMDDRHGANLRGPVFDVLCNPTGGKEPAIAVGDPILYALARNREEIEDWTPVWVNTYQKWETESAIESSGSDGLGGPGYVDLHACGAWNRCGKYIVIPQKRIHHDAWGRITKIEVIANDVIPLDICESSGSDGSDYLP